MSCVDLLLHSRCVEMPVAARTANRKARRRQTNEEGRREVEITNKGKGQQSNRERSRVARSETLRSRAFGMPFDVVQMPWLVQEEKV